MIRYVPGQWNPSEVAQFLQKWDAETVAMQQGLKGLALGSVQHEFSIHNMTDALSTVPLPDQETLPTTAQVQGMKPCSSSPVSCSE